MNTRNLRKGILYEFRLNNGSDAIVARILEVCGKHIIVNELSRYGQQDGFQYLEMDCIAQIIEGSEYAESVERLRKCYNEVPRREPVIDRANMKYSFLKNAYDLCKIVRIEVLNSGYWDVTGMIKEISEQDLLFEGVGEYGQYNGMYVVSIDDITRIEYDDCECRRREMLRTGDGSQCR